MTKLPSVPHKVSEGPGSKNNISKTRKRVRTPVERLLHEIKKTDWLQRQVDKLNARDFESFQLRLHMEVV